MQIYIAAQKSCQPQTACYIINHCQLINAPIDAPIERTAVQRKSIHIRPAIPDDLADILAIKNHYIETSSAMWYEHPLGQSEINAWWAEHAGRADRPIYVAVEAPPDASDESLTGGGSILGRVVGYASLSDFRSHDGYRHTAENSVYLLPGYEGMHLASDLMRAAIDAARAAGLRVVTAWIDGENQRSIDFHSHLGFEMVGMMKNIGILRGQLRDVVIMDLEL